MPSDSARPAGSTSLGPGMVLDGKYEILNRLGAGGMGEVFKARHLHLNTFRCIKVMRENLLADENIRNRFLREARLATQIHHQNIAVVHDFFFGEGGSYMVTEFIDGTTLRQWSAAYGPFPLGVAADVAVQVLAGLDHIHRRGLLHRDISPDNVMLTYDADDRLIAKIIDLGIAKDINTVSADTTQAGVLIGNPKYMSPEQFGSLDDKEQLDGRADLYCLGVVLYEMLLGVPPFVSETPQGYIMKHLMAKPRRFTEAKPGTIWSNGVEEIIFRALEKDRRHRFGDARELSETLQRFLIAPAGNLTRDMVGQLRRAPAVEATAITDMPVDMPTIANEPLETQTERDWKKTIAANTVAAYRDYINNHPDAPETTEAKARFFELSLLDDVKAREAEGDREALQRLGEGHPRGSVVGDAAREALGRVSKLRQRDADEENAFQQAWESGQPASWRAFLDAYPDSTRADRARQFLEETIAFETVSAQDSETGLREFLKTHPEGRHHLEAEIRLVALKQRLAEAAFAQAVAADTYGALREFLAKYPASAHGDEAKQRAAERLAFETAVAAASEDGWEGYLEKWSADPHAAIARAKLDEIHAQEEREYARAADAKTAAAWEAFLASYPYGRRNARAEMNRREAVAFEEARGGGRAALQEYLRRHPNGLLTREAQRLMRQAGDAEDFAHAESMKTARAWQLYLASHPGGAHVATARERLAVLEDTAFADVLSSKNAKAATAFLADFPESPRREELTRLMAKWRETTTMQEALDAIAAEDLARAESLLGQISDGERRREITSAMEALRARRRDAARRTEPADWNAAWEAGTVDAWDQYLAAHPDSTRIEEARHWRHEATDFELAVTNDNRAMWRAFLKTWPEGRHAMEASIRLRITRS